MVMITACHTPVASLLPISAAASQASSTYLELPYLNRVIFLALTDIVWLEGAGNYTYIHTRDNRRYLSSKTLKRLEPALADLVFCRVHKSAIINLIYLTEVSFNAGGPHLYLKNTRQITISRRRLSATRRQVKQYQRGLKVGQSVIA
ncbi:MAG: LytTR family transcriptional regulator [Cytophagaceae bacterium]|nr:MAG: LytTR family transcriptional regulator [Cytophagaceae bacterium]